MKKQIIYSSLLAIVIAFTFNACKKKQEVDNETQTVVDNALCEQQFMAIGPTVNDRGAGSPKNAGFKIMSSSTWSVVGNDSILNGQTTINNDDTLSDATGKYINGPVNFKIVYSGVADVDGVVKSGEIKIRSTHRWSALTGTNVATVGASTITFNNYTADGVKYDGEVKLSKNGNSITTIIEDIDGKRGHCSKEGWNIYYYCNKTVTQEANGDYSITGNSGGVNREGRKFTVQIKTKLIKPVDYKFITSGVLEITPTPFKTRTVDFGNGSKDADAKFTVNGQTVNFTMQ